jgi:hypothetical protein
MIFLFLSILSDKLLITRTWEVGFVTQFTWLERQRFSRRSQPLLLLVPMHYPLYVVPIFIYVFILSALSPKHYKKCELVLGREITLQGKPGVEMRNLDQTFHLVIRYLPKVALVVI